MSEPPTPPLIDDRELVLRTIALTAERASAVQRGELTEPSLPHPIRTDANLGHHLDVATGALGSGVRTKLSSAGGAAGRAGGRLLDRVWRRLGRADQARYNDAIVNALHQLDHRTTLQAHRIARLEAELSEARRAIAERP